MPTAFVTGASGFIGKALVRALLNRNYKVRAGVHCQNKISQFEENKNFETVEIDICNKNSLEDVFDGVDFLYHFAAIVSSKVPAKEISHVNVDGTRNIWEAASRAGVKKALYCSSTAVYGLLSRKKDPITEEVPAKAVEPYGKSKRDGEKVVEKISYREGLKSIIIRPTAVFGPGDRTSFGQELRRAAYSKLLLSGGFHNKAFSYVHVRDVTDAAIHLMENEYNHGQVFNVAVDQPITYEEAFRSYMSALDGAGLKYAKLRVLGKISLIIEKIPSVTRWLSAKNGLPFVFGIWKPGFDLTYSSQKLLSTSYQYKWTNFESIITSCIHSSKD
jgi:nucleoside-diphosphate-sugar epimerase